MAGRAELEEHLRLRGRLLDPQLERGAQPRGRLVERERAGRGAGREQVVLDPALRPAERRGGGEVVREVGEHSAGALLAVLEGLADAQMELRAPHRGEPVVQRPAHELVGEAVGEPA